MLSTNEACPVTETIVPCMGLSIIKIRRGLMIRFHLHEFLMMVWKRYQHCWSPVRRIHYSTGRLCGDFVGFVVVSVKLMKNGYWGRHDAHVFTGWMDGWMDGWWVDGWMDGFINWG